MQTQIAQEEREALAALDHLLEVGELPFDPGVIESLAAQYTEELTANAFRGDPQQILLPVRLLRLAQMLREGDARASSYAFLTGMHCALQDPPIQRLRDLTKKWSNRRGKGADPVAVKEAVERLLHTQPQTPAAEVYRKVAEKLNVKPRTVRRYAPLKSIRAAGKAGEEQTGD